MEEAIIQKLLATAGVTSLAQTRIYPGSLPQADQLPAVVVNRLSGAPLMSDDGEEPLLDARIQVDCWARTYTAAKQLARAVTDSLNAFVGEANGTPIYHIELDTERDLREGGSNAAEYFFRTALDFFVWSEV